MEPQYDQNVAVSDNTEDEDFNCCVCWELMYKPVVLACGHTCCFWCVRQTMNGVMNSNCPICRQPFNHFPNVCKLLHDVIKALYPVAYESREIQVKEEEKQRGYCSPQFLEDFSTHSQTACTGSLPDSTIFSSAKKGDPSCTGNFPSHESNVHSCSDIVLEDQTDAEDSCSDNKVVKECPLRTQKNLSTVDFSCPSCKSLLFRPVALNCGHVYCEHCLCDLQNSTLKCQVCESPNPTGISKVCLVLNNFIADRFQELHKQRRESVLNQSNNKIGDPSQSALHTSQPTTKPDDYVLWLTGRGPKVHIGICCDYCGMNPIIGERYKCLDCTEIIGFDLCETCYARTSIFPGRFNQQHKLDHRFEVEEPFIFNRAIIGPLMGEPVEDDE